MKSAVKRLDPVAPKALWDDSQNNFDKKFFPYYSVPTSSPRRLYNEPSVSSPRKNLSLPSRANISKYSPSHRFSHGNFTSYNKRRHKHRRSSSESPKIHKTSTNGYPSHSTSSKSNVDNSDDRAYRSSSSGSALTPTLKQTKGPIERISKEHQWAHTSNCLSKQDVPPGRESSVHSPSSSLEREVLRDMKNIPVSHSKPSPAKIGNVYPKADKNPAGETKGTEKKDNDSQKSCCSEKVPHASMDPSPDLNVTTSSEKSVSCNNNPPTSKPEVKPETIVRPLVLKSFVDIPNPKILPPAKNPQKEIVIDNSVSVEVAMDKSPSPKSKSNNVSTTIVTEETTVTKANGNSKVVTVTSITTSLSHGGLKELEKRSPDQGFLESDASSEKEKVFVNDLNIETEKGARIIDCSSSCNIVTEVK